MKFLWPSAFALLGLLPLMVAVFFWMQRRRRRFAVRYSSLSLVREAIPAQSRLRRYLPLALFLLALASLVVGLARPTTVTTVPAGRATVMLALDVSRSMLANDILPSRLEAAKEAALSFIQRQQANNQIGIVAFAGFAQLVQPPTTETEELQLAIANLTTGRGTAVGSGILTAIDTIAEYNQNVAASTRGAAAEAQITPVPKGDYVPDIVVLLTDGRTNQGINPLEAAQEAVDRGVRVYTIGFGTNRGASGQGDSFGYGGGGGGWGRGFDEESLKAIADMTGGKYYTASSAGELQKVFASLPTYLMTRQETLEISFVFAAVGAILVLAAVLLSQLWHPLP